MASRIVQPGDTFVSVSREAYGTGEHAGRIAKANPGAIEPLVPNSVLVVPPLPDFPANKQTQAPNIGPNEVAILIDGVRFRFWSDLRIIRSLDGMDTISFRAPFDRGAPGFRETFRPFSFQNLVVTVGGEVLFTGTLVGITPVLEGRAKTLSISGYSQPGVLNDCTPPASAFPVEFNELALSDIAKALADPFGLSVEFTAEPGSAFERVEISPGGGVLASLADLARQRSLVISSTPGGKLLFQQSVEPGQPVAQLKQGASPVLAVSPSFAPQQYYSHITGLEAVFVGTDGSQYTVKNSALEGVLRPHTFKCPDVEGGDVKTAVNAKVGRMFGTAVAYAVKVNTWRDPAGKLWAPNTTVKLEAPDAMIYVLYEFVVRAVQFERNGDKEAAELTLVLPGSFRGEIPEALPWD